MKFMTFWPLDRAFLSNPLSPSSPRVRGIRPKRITPIYSSENSVMSIDIAEARSLFPSLSSQTPYIYADNAGGSQCCRAVIDRVVEYLSNSNVRLGGGHSVSRTAGDRVARGRETARILFNANSTQEVSLGSSSSLLIENLAKAIEGDFGDEDEIIITGEHEANVIPWKGLAARKGLGLSYWHVTSVVEGSSNPYALAYNVGTLLPLISKNTRMVAITACSNVLRSVVDVKSVVKQIRVKAAEEGAKKVEICVDCVAYAPHRRIDVQDWDVDYAVFSFYKVYGPRISALYTRFSTLAILNPPFLSVTVDKRSYKLMGGGPALELVYGITGVLEYLVAISPTSGPMSLAPLEGPGSIYSDPSTQVRLKATFMAIAGHERTLVKRLIGHLTSENFVKRGVRVVGEETANDRRTPIISFVVVNGETGDAISGMDIVEAFDAQGTMGIRYGHFSAQILLGTLKPKVDGLIRISLVHYNTIEEVDRLIEVLDEALGFRKNLTSERDCSK